MPSPTAFITLRLMPSRSSRLMPGLRGDAGGDDADVGAGDVGIVGRALELRVEVVDRAGLGDVERLALGNALGDVEQDDVAKLAHRGEVGQGSADHSGADQRDLLPSHEAAFLCCFRGGAEARRPSWRRSRPTSEVGATA